MPRVNVDNRGFSLLELIIVSAILSTLGLLTSKLMIDSIKLSSATEARFALSQTSNLVALNLSQSSRCKQALGGVKFALGSADELNKGVQLDYIAIEPANSATTLVRSKDSKLTNGAVVDSIALKPMPPIDSSLATLPSQFTAKLDLTSSAVTLSKQAVSMGPILSLKLDGDGKIESCSNTSDSSESSNSCGILTKANMVDCLNGKSIKINDSYTYYLAPVCGHSRYAPLGGVGRTATIKLVKNSSGGLDVNVTNLPTGGYDSGFWRCGGISSVPSTETVCSMASGQNMCVKHYNLDKNHAGGDISVTYQLSGGSILVKKTSGGSCSQCGDIPPGLWDQ